jgi:hypothetical protein
MNLPVQFLMAPFQRCDVAYSRHDNSLSFVDACIVTKLSRFVDRLGSRLEI